MFAITKSHKGCEIMNILALCNQSEAIEIMNTIKADKYLFICPKKLRAAQIPKHFKIGVNVWLYSHRSMKKGRYYTGLNAVKWKHVLPHDGKLIENLAICESQTMRMVERIPKITPVQYENRRRYYYDNLRYWNHIIKSFEIDVFYRCAPPHEGYDNVIAHLCEHYNIPTFYGNPFHTFNGMYRYFARKVKDNFPSFKKEYLENKKLDFMEIDLNNDLSNLLESHSIKRIPAVRPVVIPAKKRKTQKALLARYVELNKFYDSKCVIPDLKSKYIYFPLHFQYEATTCPMGGPFVDQYYAIEILSRLGITIYVKEHPRISKNRNMDYYKRLLAMPNVKFISRKIDNYSLIDNSYLVANITGTAGWEGILRGKPSLIFGNIFYEYAEGCRKIQNLEDAQKAIEDIEKGILRPTKESNTIFLYTLQKYLFKHTTKDIISSLKSEIDKLRDVE